MCMCLNTVIGVHTIGVHTNNLSVCYEYELQTQETSAGDLVSCDDSST